MDLWDRFKYQVSFRHKKTKEIKIMNNKKVYLIK